VSAGAAPGITIIVPTLNAGTLLDRLLATVAEQDFPADRLELLLLDGGSTDGTRERAAAAGWRVVDNPLVLAEPGVKLGMREARHPVRVVMAADNGLPRRDWLARVADVFAATGVRGVYTHVVDAPIDGSFCRYFNRLHADPFNWFVFGAASDPRRFGEVYPVRERGPGWVVYDLAAGDPPLLALAQGFAVRGELPGGENLQDDILPLWQLMEEGERFAYVDLGVLHHTVRSLPDFLRKYRRRAGAALAAEDAAHRQRHHRLSRRQRLRRALWLPYALTVVGPLVDALRGLRRDGDARWLWHPVASFALAVAILQVSARHYLRRR
jgi:hypothetical protein